MEFASGHRSERFRKPFLEIADSEWDKVLAVDLKGTLDAQAETGAGQPLFRVNPLKHRGEPQGIAGAALFLASPMAGFITGQTLVVNGGTIGGS